MIKCIKDKYENIIAELKYSYEFQNCYAKHSHCTFTICCIENGKIEIEFDEHDEILTPNLLAIFNPNQVHRPKKIDYQTSNLYVLYIDTAWCNSLYNNKFGINSNFLLVKDRIINNKDIFEKFIKLSRSILNSNSKNIEKESELASFITELFQNCHIINDINIFKNSKNKISLQKIENFLKDNLHKSYTLKELASQLNMNYYHFLREFKKEFGLPPHSYLLNKRVHKAKKLLLEGMDISDVARDTGFCDQSHLYKSFRKVFGTTPNTYKTNKCALT